jgi:3-keto-L-gulonate-6-phosphate decarboxylase
LDGVAKYFQEAGERGASIASILGITTDASVVEAVRSGRKNKIQVLADMYSIKKPDLTRRAQELASMGVDYLLLHRGIDEVMADPSLETLEGLEEVIDAVKIPVGAHTYTIEEAKKAADIGASFVLQAMGTPGEIAGTENEYQKVRRYIMAVKGLSAG